MADETTPKSNPEAQDAAAPATTEAKATSKPAAAAAGGDGEKPAAKAAAKKPKKEAVEDKPFGDFIQQDYLTALEKAFKDRNIQDLQLLFQDNQVQGKWQSGQREFTVYFPAADVNGLKAFSCAIAGAQPSTIESFLIDERKANLDLLVFGVMQRLNAQKWFGNN